MTGTPARRAIPADDSSKRDAAPFLRQYSALQSYYQYRMKARYRQRQASALLVYAFLLAVTGALAMGSIISPAVRPMLLGMTFPGAGFLHWATANQVMLAAVLCGVSLGAFLGALLLWFATGNVIAPVLAWAGAAFLASAPARFGLADTPGDTALPWLIGPAVLMACLLAWLMPGKQAGCAKPSTARCPAITREPIAIPDELSPDMMRRMRLLLDRALQPARRFDGFEWRDQFQTAAVRYQVNFMAYALALAQRRYAPAASCHFAEAQQYLLTKIGDRRMWGYWRLENTWGNLRFDGDPVRHQNIMYSGFTALQMAVGGASRLELHHRGKVQLSYGLDQIMALLDRQYRASPYGLLACEPNWIYPLCNLITMAGIRAADGRLGTDRWRQRAEPFLASLDREATRRDGSFIAFRSALTGIAPPAPGGIVMQAFPCLFLNALSPERAQEHWWRVRQRLDHGSWQRLFWPVDVGNYGFSRASSYAATAAAAVEMGDTAIAGECLRRLEIECPSREVDGVIHRERASLWAHALETLARSGAPDGFRELVERPGHEHGPRLISAPYPDVLVARAMCEGRSLKLVLHPGRGTLRPLLEFEGLIPDRHYRTGIDDQPFLKADAGGRALLRLQLAGRTSLSLDPVV